MSSDLKLSMAEQQLPTFPVCCSSLLRITRDISKHALRDVLQTLPVPSAAWPFMPYAAGYDMEVTARLRSLESPGWTEGAPPQLI